MSLKVVNGRFCRKKGKKNPKSDNCKQIKITKHYEDIYQRGLEVGHFSKDRTKSIETIDFVTQALLEIIKIPPEYQNLKKP